MRRVADGLTVHFGNPAERDHTLCGKLARTFDLLGTAQPFRETSERVNCVNCAKVYCAVKNEPWPSVADAALEKGTYEAVKEDGEVVNNE